MSDLAPRNHNQPIVITADDVERAHIRETIHGRGAKGLYFYEYRCIQYPRLTKTVRRERRGVAERTTFLVDGVEVVAHPRAVASSIAHMLNKPHDLVGIAGRFNARSLGAVATGIVNGHLRVTGESAERCGKLRETYPHFEGIPIDWCAAVPGDEQ